MRLLILILFITCSANAQTDTVFNQTDKQGLKQGYWKVKYPNGKIRYTALYKDNNPIGLMKRYFDDNTLLAEFYFYPNSKKIKAKLYYQAGPLAAEGNYSEKDVKDSIWNYYSYYTKTLSSRETYVRGKKHGMAYSYFSTGKIAEEKDWKNGAQNGIWRQYFENGILKFSTSYLDGKRHGQFVANYPDGKPEWKGMYQNDMREGKWNHYDINGQIIRTVEYKDGIALNAEKLLEEEQKFLDAIEKQKGKIPEPDESNVRF